MLTRMFPRATADAPGGSGGEGDADTGETTSPAVTETEEFKAALKAALDKEVSGLKKKNAEVIQRNKELRDQAARFDGIDPDEVRALLDEKHVAEVRDAGKSGDPERLLETIEKTKKQLTGKYEKDLAERDTRIAELNAENQRLVFERALDSAALDLRIDPDLKDAFDAKMARQARIEASNGSREIVVDFEGEALPFDQWVRKIWSSSAEAKKFMLAPEMPGGSGAREASGGRAGLSAEAIAKMSQADYVRARQEGKIR